MKRVSTILGLLALTFLFALVPWGCSDDDDTPTNGEVDTDPPAVVSVTALDASNVEVVFSEAVEKASAEDSDNYVFIEEAAAPPSPGDLLPRAVGDTLHVATSVLGGDGRTVTNTLWDPMNDAPYGYEISGVKDLSGNTITDPVGGGFDGSTDPDQTPPTINSHIPASGATGVPVAQSVRIEFSEAMNYNSVVGAFSWTGGGGQVSWDVDTREQNQFEFSPQELLAQNTQYTITVSGSATDLAGNHLTQTSWSFRTTTSNDNDPPTLVSTTPADGTTSVPVSTNITLQFSEAINSSGLDYILVTPEIGDGTDSWSPDGSTITFNPNDDLLSDTQYTFLFPQGAITDLAGNPMEESEIVVFTTASSLESGRIAGRLSGDPGTAAANPADAVVLISSVFIFDYENEGPPPIEGAAIAGTGGNYSVPNLIDGTFWPVAMKETNGDGDLDPDLGDAVGAYGVDFGTGDDSADSVVVTEGSQESGIDFPLIDPSAISGEVSYGGTMYGDSWFQYDFYVGLFDEDPSGGGVEPITGTEGELLGFDPEYVLHQFDNQFSDGTYWVGAYLDVDYSGTYDPAVDPAAYYMDGASIGTVTVANGSDAFAIDIVLLDPEPGASQQAGWRIPPRDPALEARAQEWRRLSEFLKRALESR